MTNVRYLVKCTIVDSRGRGSKFGQNLDNVVVERPLKKDQLSFLAKRLFEAFAKSEMRHLGARASYYLMRIICENLPSFCKVSPP